MILLERMKKQVKKASVSASKKRTSSSRTNKLPIVGNRTSIEGIEALEQFFGNLHANNGIVFVIIQHFSLHYKGIMLELLQCITELKVTTAKYLSSDAIEHSKKGLYLETIRNHIYSFTTTRPKIHVHQINGAQKPEELFSFPSVFELTKTPIIENKKSSHDFR